jgi:hypothetical protein
MAIKVGQGTGITHVLYQVHYLMARLEAQPLILNP